MTGHLSIYKLSLVIVYLFSVIGFGNSTKISNATLFSKDSTLNFTQLTEGYVRKCVEYDVITEDGYILKLFNIVGDDTKPVILANGLFESADSFAVRGEGSLAISLAKRNYSVWVGNFRGNSYSRRHLTLNPDKDRKFWDFSVHEMGYYDLPAMIEFVLYKTGQTKLQAIAHSLGTTCFYIMGSTRPEYNKKVSISISLAPIAYLQNIKLPTSLVFTAGPVLNAILLITGQEEIFKNTPNMNAMYVRACTILSIGDFNCGFILQSFLTGYDEDTYAGGFFRKSLAHYPDGSSRKTLSHLFQIRRNNNFSQYDHGLLKNIHIYKERHPPAYDLSKATMKFALFVAQNDNLSPLADGVRLRDELPNVVYFKLLDRKEMNHIDFVWGATAYQYLHPYIFEVLEAYK